MLRARLYELERQARDRRAPPTRKSQVGSGDRSERIRTYNFPQGRVTDHRINLTLYKIDKVMSGEALDEIIDALIAADPPSGSPRRRSDMSEWRGHAQGRQRTMSRRWMTIVTREAWSVLGNVAERCRGGLDDARRRARRLGGGARVDRRTSVRRIDRMVTEYEANDRRDCCGVRQA